MAISQPTHVVTLTVFDTHRFQTDYRHLWIAAGPFDDAEHVTTSLLEALSALSDAVDELERRRSTHVRQERPWEQLSLLVDL